MIDPTYTRSGNFYLDSGNVVEQIVNADGKYLKDMNE